MAWIRFSLLLMVLTTTSFGRKSNQYLRVSGSHREFDPTPYIREECHILGYCENVANYPQRYINSLLAALPDKVVGLDLHVEPADTHGYWDSTDTPLCETRTEIITPDAVRTKKGKWVYVVNGHNYTIQGYKVVLCVNPNSQCNDIVTFPGGYSSKCKQGRIERLTRVLDHDGQVKLANIPLPSCCSCSAVALD